MDKFLAPVSKSGGKDLWQTVLKNPPLRRSYIIGLTVESDLVPPAVEKGKCGAGIAIAGLAYTAHVNNISDLRVQSEIFGFVKQHLFQAALEHHREMGMAVKKKLP